MTIPAPVPSEDIDFEELIDNASFQNRYPDDSSSWLNEVDSLELEDLDDLDPAMLEEAERRALVMASESRILHEAREDLFVYMSLRYGYHCPEPADVIYPHQAVVIDDLMGLEADGNLKSYSLTAPRGFVKTSTVSDWLEWFLARHPFMKSVLVGATERTPIKRLAVIKKNILLDPLFRAVFPDIELDPERPNNKTNLCLKTDKTLIDTRSSTVEAYGINSSPEGGRTHVQWHDDVCFTPSTYVLTSSGPRPILDIEVGDNVWNKFGSPTTVRRVHQHSYEGEMVRLSIRLGYDIEATPNHKFFVKRAYRQKDGRLRRGRYSVKEPEYVAAEEIRVGDWVWCPVPGLEITSPSDGVDRDTAWLFGYYAAEGWTIGDQVLFSCHMDELDSFRSKIESIIGEEIVVHGRRERESRPNSGLIHFSDRAWARRFVSNCGSGAHEKRVPVAVFKGTEEVKNSFLRGYFDGDGCYRNRRVDLVTVSEDLARGIHFLLLSIGVAASIYQSPASSSARPNPLWSVYFSTAFSIPEDFSEFRVDSRISRPHLVEVEDKGFWLGVQGTSRFFYSGPVFNLEVSDDDHSYVAEVYGVANCTYENSVRARKDREAIKEKLRATWWPLRIGPDMIRVWTYTPWHDRDASMEIFRKKHGWKKRFIKVSPEIDCLKDVTTGEEMPLPAQRWDPHFEEFREWWSEDRLKDLWRDDPEEFRIAYWLETIAHETDMAQWKRTWLWGDPSTNKEGAIQFGFGPKHALYRCPIVSIGVDLAFGEGSQAKHTAVVVVGLREDGKRVVLDAAYGRGWATSRKVEEIHKLYKRWSADIIVVEDNAAQKMLIDLMTDNRAFDVRVESFTTDMYKEAKLKTISNEYRDNWWIIPFQDETIHGESQGCSCGRCLLIKEMENYGEFDTSDVLMGSLFAKEGLKMLGADKSAPEYRVISA